METLNVFFGQLYDDIKDPILILVDIGICDLQGDVCVFACFCVVFQRLVLGQLGELLGVINVSDTYF